jgi:hypothetical protein
LDLSRNLYFEAVIAVAVVVAAAAVVVAAVVVGVVVVPSLVFWQLIVAVVVDSAFVGLRLPSVRHSVLLINTKVIRCLNTNLKPSLDEFLKSHQM